MTPSFTSSNRARKALYLVLGFCFVGLGTLGVLLPLLPTTPFLLVASFFFVRSSPKMHHWLLRNAIFGPFLRDWAVHRGVRRPVKWTAISMILLVGGMSAASGKLPFPLLVLLLALLGIGLFVVLRLRIIDPETPQPALVSLEIVSLDGGAGDVSRPSDQGLARPSEFVESAG